MRVPGGQRLPSRLPPGTVIGARYRVETVIGEGVQSVVYLAHDVQRAMARVALKVLHRHLTGDAKTAKRFHREARILSRLEGDHVVRLLDFVVADGLLVLVLEYVEGTTLAALLEGGTRLDLESAVEITLQICAALGSAHANGVVHRDLKPANVLIVGNTGTGTRGLRVKVVDFGLGKILRGDGSSTINVTEPGMIFGTPEYMAPEQVRGDEVGPESDLYSLGIMLFEMLVGDVPFKGPNPLAAMAAHLAEVLPSPRTVVDGVSPTLEAVLQRALAKEPAERYASAREFAMAIADIREEPFVVAPANVRRDEAIGTGDTALDLPRMSLEVPHTIPLRDTARRDLPGLTSTLVSFPHRPSEPRRVAVETGRGGHRSGAGRALWLGVAIFAALLGIAVGGLAGFR